MEGSGTPNRPPPKPPRSYTLPQSSTGGSADDQPGTSHGDLNDDSADENEDHAPTPNFSTCESSSSSKDSTINHNLQASQEYDKIQNKVIPQLILTGDGEEAQGGMESLIRVEQEPDIIQSTKASSLERKVPPPRPVAPPRRKKKKNSPDGVGLVFVIIEYALYSPLPLQCGSLYHGSRYNAVIGCFPTVKMSDRQLALNLPKFDPIC